MPAISAAARATRRWCTSPRPWPCRWAASGSRSTASTPGRRAPSARHACWPPARSFRSVGIDSSPGVLRVLHDGELALARRFFAEDPIQHDQRHDGDRQSEERQLVVPALSYLARDVEIWLRRHVIDHDAMTGLQFPTVGIAVAGTARIVVLPALDLASVKHRGVIVTIRT